MMTRNGSVPASVMRSGMWQPLTPAQARRDLDTTHVLDVTTMNQGLTSNGQLLPAIPSITTSAVAQTVTAAPPTPIQTPPTPMPMGHSQRHAWHQKHHRTHPAIADIQRLHPNAPLQGAEEVELGDWNGRPVAKFQIAASPPAVGAQQAAQSLRRAASLLQSNGFAQLPPELIAGPLAALMRGGAVELHFQNGVVIRTAL
jgi:hypothetical protein